ncbi:disease resistance protein RPM1 [Trifolium repens]|nr:disease resistance protein RPM1 [Trifolium repens]
MCDPCASVLSCARETLLPLARDHLLPFARKHLFPIALDHLLPILKESVNMIRGIPNDEIAHMKHELETIEEFIHQADKMADAEGDDLADGTREKIKQLIEASFRIQDVIDEYIIRKEEELPEGVIDEYIIRDEQQLPDPGCAAGASDYVKTKMLRLQIAHDIHSIKSRIDEMKDTSSEKDHVGSSSSATNLKATSLQNLRMAPFNMAETDVVGFEKPGNKLVDWLVNGRTDLTVVSVVAMGGQGKTTLAKKVFDNNEVIKHFDCRVWITVSKSNNIEVLRGMLEELCKQQKVNPPQNIEKMTRESLIGEVKNCLQEKRYVVVFDDVWDSDFWDYIKLAMIDEKKGRRILITTRDMKVVKACRSSSFVEIHKLECLPYQQSLELFNKKAFHDLNGCCPENLVDISTEIVQKCSGLPLAIIVIGGLLSRRNRDFSEWNRFNTNLNLELKENSMIKIILGHSYHDLPYNLKSCFLYFGLYPEDCIVRSNILTKQWMAEGFVKEDTGMTLEEVAEGYLTELIRRSLVQVDLISIDGRVKGCRVHDLVHAMIIEKCEDLSFCKNIFVDKQSSLTGMVRRLSIATGSDDSVEWVEIENSQVQSLLVYGYETLPKSLLKRIPTKHKRLKVLNLELDPLYELPNDLGRLSHLKYFRVSMALEKLSVPKSIGMLSNLETLDLEDAMSIVLPKEICKLRKLRHLLGSDTNLTPLKDGIGGMTSLQTLTTFRLDDDLDENDNRELIEELGKLKQLRKLGLHEVNDKHISAMCSSINEMQQLEELSISTCGYPWDLTDMDLNSPPPKLRIVKLDVKLEKFPKWISKLKNLVKLKVKLRYWQLDYVMKLLKGMPTLLSLSISPCGFEDRMQSLLHFRDGWFKNLKELNVERFDSLKSILIDKGALGSLKKLRLYKLLQIKTLPIGIEHLEKLESLILEHMSSELKQSLIPNVGKEHWLFKQVPFVKIYNLY